MSHWDRCLRMDLGAPFSLFDREDPSTLGVPEDLGDPGVRDLRVTLNLSSMKRGKDTNIFTTHDSR